MIQLYRIIMSFPLFHNFPLEIRLMVWKLSLEPRTIEVRFSKSPRQSKHDFVSDTPNVLHTCQESRRELLKFYKIAFQTPSSMNKVYFNFDIDTLHIRPCRYSDFHLGHFLKNFPEKGQLKKISFTGLTYATSVPNHNPYLPPLILDFTALEEVVCTSQLSELESRLTENRR